MDIHGLNKIKEEGLKRLKGRRVSVCAGASCLSSGAQGIIDGARKSLKEKGQDKDVTVVPVGCMGACNEGPLVKVENGAQVEGIDYLKPEGGKCANALKESTPFFTKQVKIVLENSGVIDPEVIEEYIARDGYQALHSCLKDKEPAEVIGEIKHSGLRGRGGAGFPVGTKWETVFRFVADQKYVVCNGDEGDPGAFMDRSVLESDPHRILEGMGIAGYAVGASRGFLYVRGEYPLAIKRLEIAIKQARKAGLLGKNILESGFDFDVEIRIGAGAFVCGEETALLASIEGKRGTPKPRPPYPAQSGLWGKPTLINNVESFANIAPIIRKGAEWYNAIGTPKSAGTKVFALAGAITNTGLIEVPMGTSLREIIFDIGGGVPGGKKFKAAQTGGPSGGCIPEAHLDVKVDYESLGALGSIMGSGGLIVMDETSCMVKVARYFMEFCMDESCGKCIPCRVGTKQMHGLLDKICKGEGTLRDLELLEELAPMVKETSLCGLGQSAPNPLLSTLRYFREEYLAHINEKRCPAGTCQLHGAAVAAGGHS